jgi:predicted SAM-dependent methyltransferase
MVNAVRRDRPEWLAQRLAEETAALGPNAVRLHLGCGEVYLKGYVNIDAPADVRPVMNACAPDIQADVRTLTYPRGSVDEVRLHHLFEHFDRPTAVRLLIEWRRWLRVGGRLVIETPDFEACAESWLRTDDLAEREKLIRHLFGSHEAEWAVHREGWHREKFERYLGALGFEKLRFHYTTWCGTRNITVVARKEASDLSDSEARTAATGLLRMSLVNAENAQSEQRLLQTWLGLARLVDVSGNNSGNTE